MPKEPQLNAGRGRPISCRFCRSRKLRCSREAPCSNCISRGITCDLEPVARPSPTAVTALESELLERIRKLEELVELQRSQQTGSIRGKSEASDTRAPPEQPTNSNVSAQIENLDRDVACLASIYNGDYASDEPTANKLVFNICPIQQFMTTQPYVDHNAYNSAWCDPSRCIWLPQYSEAKILLEKFVQDIDRVHHVVHTPTLPKLLDDIYECLNGQGRLQAGRVLLLLGIIASATHCWVQSDYERGLFSSSVEANIQSPLWIRAFEDVLYNAQRCQSTTPISVEGVQGISIATFVILNMEGFSRRCKSLFNVVFFLARELGLHLIDHPANAKSAHTVEAEVGRRTWYYIVASDWIAPSKFSGSTQGIYYCHPRHMLVKKPLNANDEDLIDGVVNVEQPHSRPTTMSYSLLRIRLSEISRHLVDRSPPLMAHLGPPSHDIVMEIDTEMQELLNDIPSFFSLSKDELISTFKLAPSRAADIEHQGFMFRSLFWAQRCTLHFPYFSRGYMDAVYAPSKELCLLSAREVIHAEARIGEIGLKATRYKFLGLLVATFVASIIVLMELCHNKSSSQNEQHRMEIADAIRILEGARHESATAAKFLDSLMDVMRKHKVLPPEDTEQESTPIGGSQHVYPMSFGMNSQNAASFQPYEATNLALSGVLGSSEAATITTMEPTFESGEDLSTYYKELAQSFEQGMDPGTFDWTELFSGIDPSVI